MRNRKKQVGVLRERPKVEFHITRESVCASDDVDAPHEKLCTNHSFMDPVALTRELALGYLPTVEGHGHSWGCYFNDVLITTINQDGVIAHTSEVQYKDLNYVYFRYYSATF